MLKDIKLRFGQYKGRTLDSLPVDYLKLILDKGYIKGRAALFAKIKLNYPKTRYRVTVVDSLGQDGDYTVEAYNQQHAINVCKSQHKIQISQSGTEFFVKLPNNDQ